MKVRYDPEVDILYVELADVPIKESDELRPGIVFDYDHSGNVVGFEIQAASKRFPQPTGVEYTVVGAPNEE